MDLLYPSPRILNTGLWRGMRIGLLGGSFNPAHEGHVHISEIALRALQLDCIWWLVSPQNPLKSEVAPSFEKRMAQCRDLTKTNPRIIVSDMERALGTTRTCDSLRRLLPHFTGTSFVWLCGLDNALNFHHWYRWRDILNLTATVFISRPPASDIIRNCHLRLLNCQTHIQIGRSGRHLLEPGLTYWILDRQTNAQSSTQLRQISSAKKLFASTPERA